MIDLPALSCSRCICPGWSHHTPRPVSRSRNFSTDILIPVTTPIERLTRLIGAILMEQSGEWAVQRWRYMSLETMAPVSDNPIVMLSALPGT